MIRILDSNEDSPSPAFPLVEWVGAIFEEGGLLESKLGLEFRPQQEQMALQVAQSLAANQPLLFEAGTGVGKSLAYLIPGILFSMETERPLVTSTHTIALQEQIKTKDLPLCRTFFSSVPELSKYVEFKTALLVGKGNYLCETRLARALQQGQGELLDTEQGAELKRIQAWAETTTTGQRQELIPQPSLEVWDQVNADSSTCNRKNCGEKGCSYRRARSELLSAHVRIVNHSLLFSLLNAGMGPGGTARGILFPEDFLVLDEAHTVPGIATDHFGVGVSSYAVNFALSRLYNPVKKSGFLKKLGDRKAMELVIHARESAEEFFGILRNQYLTRKEIVRLREPDWADPILQLPLKNLIDRLGTLESRTEDENRVDEIRDHRLRITTLREGIAQTLGLTEDDQVYWLERNRSRHPVVYLRSAPLNIAPVLRKALFQRHTGVVLTSATLSLGDAMENFREKIGGEGLDSAIEHSPFDFPNRMEILIAHPEETSNPSGGRKELHQTDISRLVRFLEKALHKQAGGALVLFTSYQELTQAQRLLREYLKQLRRPLFAQGEGRSRSQLVADFQAAGNGVLLGTDSFWTGVDIPGPALSLVAIPRLPFENPTHPVAEAKSEWLRLRGENPFMKMTLPEALIKFRQGMGRLIRNQKDRGRLLLMDPRILQREYGKSFLAVLPHSGYRRVRLEDLERLENIP